MDTSVEEQERYSIKEGDIFLTRTSETLDELAMSSVAVKDYPHATYSGFLKRLRPTQSDITYAKFMAFYLRSAYFRKIIDNNATMTLRASFNEDIFSWLHLMLPDYNEQKKIGDWLYALESKIKNNHRVITTLESMAKTLYDYWFVQFDFPDANGRPYKTSGGKMEWNETLSREIPAGWEVSSLEELASYSTERISSNKLTRQNYVGMDNMIANRGGVRESEYNPPEGDMIRFKANHILLGNIRPYFKKIWLAGYDGGCNPDVLAIVANEEVIVEFLYATLSQDTFFDYDTLGAKGTKMPRGDKEHIMSYPIPWNRELAIIFGERMRTGYRIKNQLAFLNAKLTALRDYLLPMLMNGQVTFRQ